LKRHLKFLMVSVTVVMLILATSGSVFGSHLPGQGNNKAPDDTIGHEASCNAQHTVIHNVSEDLPSWANLHLLIHEECDDVLIS